MALLDLLGRRWTLRVLWELRAPVTDDPGSIFDPRSPRAARNKDRKHIGRREPRGGPTFRALQAQCHGMSSSVLSQRLAELDEAGIVTARPTGGYALTPEGEALLAALGPLDQWAQRWAERTQR